MNDKTSRATHCASALDVVCRCGEEYSLHTHTVCPRCFTFPRYGRVGDNREVERCDREISDAAGQTDKPAYLVTLGIEDWECEKRLIKAGGIRYEAAG